MSRRQAEPILQLGPDDHDRPLTREEYERARYASGSRYELVGGRLYVSPEPNFVHERVVIYLRRLLDRYGDTHPDRISLVSTSPRVITDIDGASDPEPDITAYREFPRGRTRSWRGIDPCLAVEVISEGDPDKDLVRNRRIYLRVPSILEYWIVDPRDDPPSMIALRRAGSDWAELQVAPGETYACGLLPGLVVDLGAIFPAE